MLYIISALLFFSSLLGMEEAMETEETSFTYESLDANEHQEPLDLSELSLEKIIAGIEGSAAFGAQADKTLPHDRIDEIRSVLKKKHTILLYDIFKQLYVPEQFACSSEPNNSLQGYVFLLKSGFYINSNSDTGITKIWNLGFPNQAPFIIKGCFSLITEDEKYILVDENLNASYDRAEKTVHSLYRIDTGEKVFNCPLKYRDDVLIYDANLNQGYLHRNIRQNIDSVLATIRNYSSQSYIFLVGLEKAFFQQWLVHEAFLKEVIHSSGLMRRFMVREDEKYALLWGKLFDLRSMQAFQLPERRCIMNTNGTYILMADKNNSEPRTHLIDLAQFPDINPITDFIPLDPATDLKENSAISSDGKRVIMAFRELNEKSQSYISWKQKRGPYRWMRKYVLYDVSTGKSCILNGGNFVDLEGIRHYNTEHMVFDQNGDLFIARDNVYKYDFERSIPDLSLELFSFLLQLSQQSQEYCKTHKSHLVDYIDKLFIDLRNARISRIFQSGESPVNEKQLIDSIDTVIKDLRNSVLAYFFN